MPRKALLLALSVSALALAGPIVAPFAASPAQAQEADAAAGRIDSFNQALLATMKAGKAAGLAGRTAKIGPAIGSTFDLATMTRIAVGPTWNSLSAAQKSALIKAFSRYTVAAYARNFDEWSGQKFGIDQVQTRGPDKLVQSHMIKKDGDSVSLAYRMRQVGGTWKVIDVYYKGSVSELTTRRSDFSAILAKDGPDALVRHLNELADKPAK